MTSFKELIEILKDGEPGVGDVHVATALGNEGPTSFGPVSPRRRRRSAGISTVAPSSVPSTSGPTPVVTATTKGSIEDRIRRLRERRGDTAGGLLADEPVGKRYASVADLPRAVRDKYRDRPKKLRQWMHVFNGEFDAHGDDKRAFASAWSAVQKRADNLTIDVPLLIKLFEFAREEATDDETLHRLTERLIARATPNGVLTMSDYAAATASLRKAVESLSNAPIVGLKNRRLEPFDAGTYHVPFRYSPSALASMRPDQVPRFLDAVTHPKRLPLETVALTNLYAVKDRVGGDVVRRHLKRIGRGKSMKPPVVVRLAGSNHVADGHDRLTADWLNGDDVAFVRYLDLDPVSEAKPDPKTDHAGSLYDLLQPANGRRLSWNPNGTLAVPFTYDPAFFAGLRADQVPRFLYAITHQDEVPTRTVKLADLRAIQDRVNPDTVAAHVETPTDKPPIVVRVNGADYVGDGHDRLTARWLSGADDAVVRYADLGRLPNNAMKRADPNVGNDLLEKFVGRDAFTYLSPSGQRAGSFAQCSTCAFNRPTVGRCAVLIDAATGPTISCDFYAPGAPEDDQRQLDAVSKTAGGYVDRPVRCENCDFFHPERSDCELFEALNAALPTVFKLDVGVEPLGCCDAQLPKRLPIAKRTPEPTWSVPFEVRKADPTGRMIFGWASIVTKAGRPVLDLQDDVIAVEDLEKAIYDYVLYARDQGHMHKTMGVGRLIECMMFTKEKQDVLGITLRDADGDPIEGAWVGYLVDDDAVWDAHKRGELPAFSIGGSAASEKIA